MSNSLFNAYGAPQNNGIAQMINQINNFKSNFKGNPRAEVERMMQSGQLSQEQFNQYAQVASELVKYIK